MIGRKGIFELGHVSCFIYQEYDFSDTFDITLLEQSWNYLIQRHEALRIIFPSDTEQQILKEVPYYTVSEHIIDDNNSINDQLIERRERLSHQIRAADQWPLFDIQTTRFMINNEYRIRLHVGIDILFLDLWSMILIFYEFQQIYHHPNISFIPLTLSYRDYILTEQKLKDTIIYKNDEEYWLNRLDSFPLAPRLPLQCQPNQIIQQRHSPSFLRLDRSLWQRLRQLILIHRWTPAAFLVSIYSIVLAKWSENKHFTLNLPVFHRLPIHSQINQIAGDFTSIIPLEINLNQSMTFIQLFETVQKQLWNDLEHISYNGVSFIRHLAQRHQIQGVVLPFVFTCGIDLIDRDQQDYHLFNQSPIYQTSQTPQVFLDHVLYEDDQHLISMWIYVQNLFPLNIIIQMHQGFIDLLQDLALSNHMWDKSILIPLPNIQQDRRLIFNQTQWNSQIQKKLLHLLIIEQANRTPEAWAILSSQQNLTYQQLMNRVYSLAHHLRQQQNIQTNQLIVILMKKGWEQVVACLAILMTGAAYLPLDIDSPYDRLCALIDQSNAYFILRQSDCPHQFEHLTTIPIDTFIYDQHPQSFLIKQQSSTDLAYVIYTSGSTGKPKGVMITHQAVLNTILDINSRLEVSSNDRILALSHLNFDLSVYDLFGMLIAGGTIVIPDHEQYKNPQHWYEMIIHHHVTIWNTVPMLMQMFVEHLHHTHHHNQLRHILLSGDWIPLSLPNAIRTTFGEDITITSLGGATEASIWSIALTLPKEIPQQWKSIPYGTPLRNQRYYVYDVHLDHCPEWVIGDLYISGIGLADGYWCDQEQTQSGFVVHPRTGERLYRTGDQGRFLPDGYIHFIGRKDFQVKIHGHRIELGEIEYHLQNHSQIHQTIVTVDQTSQQLIAYLVPYIYTDRSETKINDFIERIHFKLARHGRCQRGKQTLTFPLQKPKLTEKLINTYFARKSYRQFTDQIIKISTIEKLMRQSYTMQSNNQICTSNLDFNCLTQLLSVLTPINISTDQLLPKYRYASAGSLYPVQVYVEFSTSIDNIPSGLYYHNADEHSLDFVDNYVNNEDIAKIRLHLVGQSSAIAPLYGQTLGREFCTLEMGYIVGLMEKEASTLGLVLSKVSNDKALKCLLNLDENDTHLCFTISSDDRHRSNDDMNNKCPCIVYLNTDRHNSNHRWFISDKECQNLIPIHSEEEEVKKDEMPLVFDTDDDTKMIFHDCQSAIFFVGQAAHRFNVGVVSHLLMDYGLDQNIGMCPIGTPINLPKQINLTLNRILTEHHFSTNSVLLHTLLLGKVTDEQKYQRSTSKVKPMSDWREILRLHISKQLPSYMIPSHFIILPSFPLNANGKIDRKCLPPPPKFSSTIANDDDGSLFHLTALEQQLRDIFIEAFHNTSVDMTMPFFRMGGTSLDAIRVVHLIRQKIYSQLDATLLFMNPSIRQLAQAIQPLLSIDDDVSIAKIDSSLKNDVETLKPSLCIELICILLLLSHWLFPIWTACSVNPLLLVVFIPIYHLITYVVCQRLLIVSRERKKQVYRLYSWDYYRWQFLNNMWSYSTFFWLRHLIGTPFYNAYLRLCGATIGCHSHIYTIFIDAPWLIEVGESTFIGEEVVLSSIDYHRHTFELHPIQIGSHCSIETRSILYGSVIMEDNVYAQEMSSITGHIIAPNHEISVNNRSFSFVHRLYQFISLLFLLFIHELLIYFVYLIYHNWLIVLLPVAVSLTLVWLVWILMSFVIVMLLLKYVVGSAISGHYPLNSFYYLHKLWLRRLLVSSFHHAILAVPPFDVFASIILRWLGARIDDDVKFAQFEQILPFPSNLLHIERGVTTFGSVKLAPFHMTRETLCYVDKIHLDSEVNLGNNCIILPGTRLLSGQIVGCLTLVTRESNSDDPRNNILLGIPARPMSFAISDNTSLVDDSLSSNCQSIQTWLFVCLAFFISKYLLIIIYLSVPLIIAFVIHVLFFCIVHHYSISFMETRSQFRFSEVVSQSQNVLQALLSDFDDFIGWYLSGTQYLVFLYRFLGAQIGSDVIIGRSNCLGDPEFVSIGDHVRLDAYSYIQV